MYIEEVQHTVPDSFLDSSKLTDTPQNGTSVEVIRALIAVESFGEGYTLVKALEAGHYIPDYLMVLNNEYLAAALTAEPWDVVLCSADTANFSIHEMLTLAQACDAERAKTIADTRTNDNDTEIPDNRKNIAPTLFFVLSDNLSAESAADLLKAGAIDVLRHGNAERLRTSLRREFTQRRLQVQTHKKPSEPPEATHYPQSGYPKSASAIMSRNDDIDENSNDTFRQDNDSDEHFRHLVQHSRDIISMLDEELRVIYQSPAFYRLFHYSEEDILGWSALDFIHPEDVELFADALRMAVAAPGTQVTITFRARTAKDRYRTIESIITNRLDHPAIRAIIVNSRDISDRTGMEDALRESEQQYRTLVENLSEGIIITDKDDTFIFVNPAAEKTFGVERGQLIGQTIEPFIKPETKVLVDDQNNERRAGKAGRYELEIIRANGTKRWQTINSTPRFDDSGVFMGSFVIFNDITERKSNEEANVLFSQFLERRINERTEALKRANAELKHEIAERKRIEEMLLQSGERLNSLLRNSSDVITIVEENGDISYESPATEKVFGFEPFERIGHSFLDRVHADDKDAVRSFLHDVIHQPDAIRTIEFLHRSDKKNDYEWIEVTASNQLHNAAVGGIVLNSRDIATRKAAEQELKRALQQEKELGDLKSRFITMVSHEFRTPLTVINSSAEILHLSAGKMPVEKQNMHLERMMASSGRIEQMLNDVLLLARGEAGKTNAAFAALMLKEFCEEIVSELHAASGGEQRISVHFTSSAPSQPALDEKLMRSIITNLLSNALKYSHAAVLLDIDCTPSTITIRVEDKGIGIPGEDQKHMFEAFHRAHNALNIKGTGIGMSIVKYAVDAHGGTIDFTSIENEGTTFIVSLPFRTPSLESVIDRS